MWSKRWRVLGLDGRHLSLISASCSPSFRKKFPIQVIFDDFLAKHPDQKVRLIFVIDPRRYRTLRRQSFYGLDGKPLKTDTKTRIPWIEQWAWEMDISQAVTDYKAAFVVPKKRKRMDADGEDELTLLTHGGS
jgi:hypothetical protein